MRTLLAAVLGFLALLAGTGDAPPAASGSQGSFHPLAPCRLIDTRLPAGPFGGPALQPGAARTFDVVGVCAITADAVALSLNVTVTNATADGVVNLYEAGIAPPETLVLAYRAGRTRANNAIVSLGGTPRTMFIAVAASAGPVDLIVDASGYFDAVSAPPPTATFTPAPSSTPTSTPISSSTPTRTPTFTPTPTPTLTPTSTPTLALTATPTSTPTASSTSTGTPSLTPTATPTSTPTSTPPSSSTPTPTPTPTPTSTPIAGLAQTIAFGPLSNQPLLTPPFTVSATASSGLPVSFASQTAGVCTVVGAQVTIVAAGTCAIRAMQAGNATYAPAPNVDRSFTVVATSSTIRFADALNYSSGGYPGAVAVADFNSDGKADLALVNYTRGSVSVSIGNGDGTFTPGVELATGSGPTQVVVADFNGDGIADLAVTAITGNSVTVYLGNGDGTFIWPSRTVPAGLAPFGIAAADLNGDGKVDLVVANGSSGSIVGQTVTVLLGNGDGTFQPATAYATGTNTLAVAIADFNGDGKLDLAATNAANNNVSILLGNGDGSFRPQVTYAVGAYPKALSVADFDGDGKTDIAVLNSNGNSISILIGRGDGTFATATNLAVGSTPGALTTGDFDGDGIVDIVSTQYFNSVVVVLQGNGNGTFKPAISFPVGSYPGNLAAGDLNRDGRLDLVASNYLGNTVSVLLNAPAGITVSALTGTRQSAIINTLFSTALSAVVRDASNAAIVGATVTFTAPAGGAAGTFQGGATTIGVTTNSSGVATAPTFTANAVAGAFTVTASYGGSSTNFSLTNTRSQTITFGALSDRALSDSPFTVSATASSGLPVTFSSQTVSVCTVSGDTVTLVAMGTCTIRGAQSGNATYAAAPDVDRSLQITAPSNWPPVVSISLGLQGTLVAPASLFVGATASDPDGFVAQVEFFSGTTSLGIRTSAPYSVPFTAAAGTYTFTAKATDDRGATASSTTSIVVPPDQLPTIAITGPPAGTAFVAPANIPLLAHAVDPDGTISRVEFWNGTTLIQTLLHGNDSGTFISPDYSFNWSGVGAGSYSLTAKAVDEKGGETISAPVIFVVNDLVPGAARFAHTFDYPLDTAAQRGGSPFSLALGDFNGDGKPDLVASGSPGGTVLFTSAGGIFPDATNIPGGGAGLVAGDFNGDGKLDFAGASGSFVLVALGNGNGTFQNAVSSTAGIYSPALAAGDFNGDGKLDLAAADFYGQVYVLLGNGDGSFQPAVGMAALTSLDSILAGDFNGDGNLDLVVATSFYRAAVILFGNGNGTFQAPVSLPIGSIAPKAVASGDFNGDGHRDLVFADSSGNRIAVLLGDGHGGFSPAVYYPAGQSPADLAVGDFDGDGKLDLAVANHGGNIVSILLGAGGGAFQAPISLFGGPNPAQILAADLNGDGHADLVVRNDSTVAVLINTTFSTTHAPVFTTSRPPNATVGVPYSFKVTASGAPTPALRLSAGLLGGYDRIPRDGTINIASPYPGTYYGVITATNGVAPDASQGFAIVVEGIPQAISFGPLTGRMLGDPPFAVSATASSSGAVGFASLASGVCTVTGTTVTLVAAGTCTIRASQPGDGFYYLPAPDVDQSFTVFPTGTLPAVQLVAPVAGAVFSAPASVTLLASATSKTVTVDFYQGATKVCTATTRPYSCLRAGLPAGSYSFTAKATDNASVIATSAAVSITVTTTNQPPAVAITAPLPGSVFGAPGAFTLMAAATDPDGSVAQVEFLSGSTSLGVVTSPPYRLALRDLPPGAYAYAAKATDDKGAATTSAPVSVTVTAADLPPTVTITSPADGAVIDIPSTFDPASIFVTTHVDDPDGAVVRGSFFVNGVEMCITNDLPQSPGYSCTPPLAAPGIYTYTAQVTDNRGAVTTSAPVVVTVRVAPPNIRPVVTLTSPLTGALLRSGPVSFSANAWDADGSIARVEFLADNTVVATLTSPPWTFGAIGMTEGAHVFAARATDDRGAATTSPGAYVYLLPRSILVGFYSLYEFPLVALTAPVTCGPFSAGIPLVLAADVRSEFDSIARVDFYSGGAVIGTATAFPYTFTWASPTAGTLSLSAVAYDSRGLWTQSTPVRVTLTGNQPPTATLTAPAPGTTYSLGQTVTLRANASDPDGTVSKVDFRANGTLVGTATAAPYQVSWTPATAATYSLTATATDNASATGVSAPVSITVYPAPTASLTAPSAGTKFAPGQSVSVTAQVATPGRTIVRVEFLADGSVVSTVTPGGSVSSATLTGTWTAGAPGAHTLSARVVSSDTATGVSPGVGVTVVDLAVNLIEPFAGETYLSPADIRITADPSETGGTVAQVDFYGDGALLGSGFAPPYTWLWTGIPAGTHTVVGKVRDSTGLITSAPISVFVVSAPTLQIDPGIDGSTVADDNVSVSGTVQTPPNSAVTVNGQRAALDLAGRFFVNGVLLQAGSNVITVSLSTQDASTISRTITVIRAGTAAFGITLDRNQGVAPFTANVRLTNRSVAAFGRVEIDLNGDGSSDVTVTSLMNGEATQAITFPNPGVYTLGFKVFDASNALVLATTRKVRAYGPDELGAKVARIYTTLVDRLGTGNVAGALTLFGGDSRQRYADAFAALAGTLPAVAAQLGDMVSGVIGESHAELMIARGSGPSRKLFTVHLVLGADGIWRVENM